MPPPGAIDFWRMCQPTQPEEHKMRVFDTYKKDKEDVPIHAFITAAEKSASARAARPRARSTAGSPRSGSSSASTRASSSSSARPASASSPAARARSRRVDGNYLPERLSRSMRARGA